MLDNLIAVIAFLISGTSNHVRIYMCIKGVSAGAPSLTEKITKSDKYWFSVPYDK